MRLWNPADTPSTSTIRMPGLQLADVRPVNLVEEPLPGTVDNTADSFRVKILSRSVCTYRCSCTNTISKNLIVVQEQGIRLLFLGELFD